ncbi:hypothetical protein KEJ18_02890 [Candidatus Bathyarchaeota archaeon]|nr:hypothetical protein [Candidatus Bathyarchaeota archaeon]
MFRTDLSETERDGQFSCPVCEITISPDDFSDLTHNILNVKTKVDKRMEEAIIQCRTCGSIICLSGFGFLEDLSCTQYLGIREYLSLRVDLRQHNSCNNVTVAKRVGRR